MKEEKNQKSVIAARESAPPRRFRMKKREKLDAQKEIYEKTVWERIFEKITGSDTDLEEMFSAQRALDLREKLKIVGILSLCFFLSLVMSLARLSFQCYPVGFALVCAVGGKKKIVSILSHSAFCAAMIAGVLTSCVFVESYPFVHFAVCCAAFLTRLAMTSGGLDESVMARSAVATCAAALCGLIRGILEGFTLPSVFMLVTVTILAPVACYVLSGFYADGSENSGVTHFECAFLAMAAMVIYSIRELSFWGVTPAFVLALIFTLGVAKFRGPIYGAVAGLAVGLACGSSLYGAVMGLSGFFSGLFFPGSDLMALMLSFVISAGFSIFGASFSGFGTVADDFIIGACLFYPFRKLFRVTDKKIMKLSAIEVYRDAEGIHKANTRLERLSDAFCSLSEVFYTVSDKMKTPDITETSALVSECCSGVCSSCRMSGICWGKEYGATRDVSFKLAQALLERGTVTKEDLSDHFRNKCIKYEQILSGINEGFSRLCSDCFNDNRTKILAGEYSTVSKLLKTTAGQFAGELKLCPDLEARTRKLLKRLGIDYNRLTVFGRREMKIDVYGVSPESIRLDSQKIREEFEGEFACRFEDPAFILLEKKAVMRMRKKRKIVLECAKVCRAKNGETVNGDTAGFFESDSDQFYSMICDGMGSGRDAAITSRLAQIFIEKLLSCSSPQGITFEMLNSFLLAKNNECFTTVDLLEVDLLSGEGNFIKAGAAPSYVLRGENIFRIASRTPPAGILPRMSAEKTGLELQEGDIVVMVSDGIAGGEEAESWLCEKICFAAQRQPAALASAILQEAADRERISDDMTVFVIAVKSAA